MNDVPPSSRSRRRSARTRWLRDTTELCLLLAAVCLLAILTTRHPLVMDWTANARNTLAPASRALLEQLSGPIQVQAFVGSGHGLRRGIVQLAERYQQHYPQLSLEFVDPAVEPRRAREANVTSDGTLVITHAGRSEAVTGLSERVLSAALNRLARAGKRWIAYTSGAGERDLLGDSREDLGRFGQLLRTLGFRLRPLNLGEGGGVPDNVSLLVVLEPGTDPLPGGMQAIERFLDGGGNLLWLSDARQHASLIPLGAALGVQRDRGLLVDPNSELYGRPTPEFILVPGYAEHPVTATLEASTAFPTATSLTWESTRGWKVKGLAASPFNSWLESGDLQAAVRFDEGADTPGPLDLAVVLERPAPDGRTQRAAVFGDADFLSNAYLGLVGNKALGQAVVNWLVHDDDLIDVPSPAAVDLDFSPSAASAAVIALGAPLLLPLLILTVGAVLWRRRRRR